MTPAEQKRKITNMMTGRRLALANRGPRVFPEYTSQDTKDYVREYEYMNRTNGGCVRPFRLEDLQPPVGYGRKGK